MPMNAVVTSIGTLTLTLVRDVTFRLLSNISIDMTAAVITFQSVGGGSISWSTTTGEITIVGGTPSTVTLVVSSAATAELSVGSLEYTLTAQFPDGGDDVELAGGFLRIVNS
jgi:hypothetical protein